MFSEFEERFLLFEKPFQTIFCKLRHNRQNRMDFQTIRPEESLSLMVKDIWLIEQVENSSTNSTLPFFADGYPGLMFQQTENGLTVMPHDKQMPVLFLYGQTVQPIELRISGTYQLIVFRLYPFVLRSFFGVNPSVLKDDCYDLLKLTFADVPTLNAELLSLSVAEQRIAKISTFLECLFLSKAARIDTRVRQAIEMIVAAKGQTDINEVQSEMNLNKRTLERKFLAEVGLSPKQFAKIIQFYASWEQLAVKDFEKLTDIAYENGFADQSHFIKVFKAFTGKTPKTFK